MKAAAAVASPVMGPGLDTPATAAVTTPGSGADRRPGSSSLSTTTTTATLPSSPTSSIQTSANAMAAQASDKPTQLQRSSSSSSRPEMKATRVASPNVIAKSDGKNTNNSSRKASSANNTTADQTTGTSPVEANDCQAADAANASQDDSSTGPGKRKRKPSTLGRPPSTITIAPSPSPAVASGSSSSACSKRDVSVGISSQKSRTSPSISGASSSEPGKLRIKVRHSAGSSLVKRPNLPSVRENTAGYDSDGGQAAPLRGEGLPYYMEAKMRAARDDGMEVDEEGDIDDVDHLAAPPLFYQRSRSGHAAIGKASSELRKSSSAATNGRKRAAQSKAPSGISATVTPLQQGQSRQLLLKPQRQVGHHRTKSMPSISSQVLPSISRCQRSSLETADLGDVSGAETTDAEDEDDFHREMMEADFDAFDSGESWMGKSGEVDTPATTPRSPQSTCDPLSDHHEAASSGKASVRSSSDPEISAVAPAMVDTSSSENNGSKTKASSKSDNAKAVKKEVDSSSTESSRDAVFAHALPPSSRRTQTHAGLLTLSLPYDETKVYTSPIGKQGMTTPTLKRSATGHGGGVRVVRIKEEDDEEDESASHQLLRLLHDSAQARLEGRSKADEHDETTSPPLSPTQALLKAGPGRENHLNLPGTASLTSSPFLSAVHHHASSVSRPGTPPAGFNLPPSIVAKEWMVRRGGQIARLCTLRMTRTATIRPPTLVPSRQKPPPPTCATHCLVCRRRWTWMTSMLPTVGMVGLLCSAPLRPGMPPWCRVDKASACASKASSHPRMAVVLSKNSRREDCRSYLAMSRKRQRRPVRRTR
ncbi:hypothetical protein BCV69DRAFT_215499 [Microstroma glucosiphilum]|uniref:Uncharacterized protein n=1 Tax=Pseudomicrostroma glucosiphilum TaxID=1684307 RepID=A0A316U445_9BASI|nr:hypothetical protein BCV69DRAFT_215499 [Pseudomicrostroma glucosiphilum]PWN19997.1 hypothetical protein BCV69DRAFT_215499 [Pseudomicrostroma glucosiphilum]